MARSIGLPSRVAVGFTPGVTDEVDRNLYSVRGEHAHAWPEVYINGAGWVAFEPTPHRGAPGAANYTGVGTDYPLLQDIQKYVVDKGLSRSPEEVVGNVLRSLDKRETQGNNATYAPPATTTTVDDEPF